MKTSVSPRVSVVHRPDVTYPSFPYSRDRDYPELRKWPSKTDGSNQVFGQVRQALLDLGLDEKRRDTALWNPLGEFIKPGQRVLLKPNWVLDHNQQNPSSNLDELVTHSSVISVIIEYVVLALDGRGTITIADAPIQSCDFPKLMAKTHFTDLKERLQQAYPKIRFEIIDLRKTIQTSSGQTKHDGDPRGYLLVDLRDDSLLGDLDARAHRLRVTNYNHNLLHQHHRAGTHQYLVSRSVLEADAIINIPKMKCHLKAGLTGSLKNLIGINGHKEYLPHHINGSPAEGGDQYIYRSTMKRLYNRLYDWYWSRPTNNPANVVGFLVKSLAYIVRRSSRDDLLEGGWAGNDTIPRTTIDLSNLLMYYDLDLEKLGSVPSRKVLHILDGVIAGEGNGPLKPNAKSAGVILASLNPLLADTVQAKLMGYSFERLKTLVHGYGHPSSRLNPDELTPDELLITYNGKVTPLQKLPNMRFMRPHHWGEKERCPLPQ